MGTEERKKSRTLDNEKQSEGAPNSPN